MTNDDETCNSGGENNKDLEMLIINSNAHNNHSNNNNNVNKKSAGDSSSSSKKRAAAHHHNSHSRATSNVEDPCEKEPLHSTENGNEKNSLGDDFYESVSTSAAANQKEKSLHDDGNELRAEEGEEGAEEIDEEDEENMIMGEEEMMLAEEEAAALNHYHNHEDETGSLLMKEEDCSSRNQENQQGGSSGLGIGGLIGNHMSHEHEHDLDHEHDDHELMNLAGPSSGSSSSNPCQQQQHSNGVSKTKAPFVSQWLESNYEAFEGVSLPRSTLYAHYLERCRLASVEPVNAASFGKIIRAVFPNLKTRRLGTRGNSKYHYYGIKLKSDQQQILLDESLDGEANTPLGAGSLHHASPSHLHPHAHHHGVMPKAVSAPKPRGPSKKNRSSELLDLNGGSDSIKQSSSHHKKSNKNSSSNNNNVVHQGQMLMMNAAANTGSCSNNNGSNGSAAALKMPTSVLAAANDEFVCLLQEHCSPIPVNIPPHISIESLQEFCILYQNHCQRIITLLSMKEFINFDHILKQFWQSLGGKIISSLNCEEACRIVGVTDDILHHTIIQMLLGNVLEPISMATTQQIRHFAKNLEIWLLSALDGFPIALVDIKIEGAKRFTHVLRRRTSLNHLAQAARTVLQNPDQVSQMLHDWSQIDFESVKEQASWIVLCRENIFESVEESFRTYLLQGVGLEFWAEWLEGIVDQCLASETLDIMDHPNLYENAARQFLLKWSFFSTLIMRDLTLRSASSFGSFHLMRLLYDEYIFYVVERKLEDLKRRVYEEHWNNNNNGVSTTAANMGNATNLVVVEHPFSTTPNGSSNSNNNNGNSNVNGTNNSSNGNNASSYPVLVNSGNSNNNASNGGSSAAAAAAAAKVFDDYTSVYLSESGASSSVTNNNNNVQMVMVNSSNAENASTEEDNANDSSNNNNNTMIVQLVNPPSNNNNNINSLHPHHHAHLQSLHNSNANVMSGHNGQMLLTQQQQQHMSTMQQAQQVLVNSSGNVDGAVGANQANSNNNSSSTSSSASKTGAASVEDRLNFSQQKKKIRVDSSLAAILNC